MNMRTYQNARGRIHRLRARLGRIITAVSVLLAVVAFGALGQSHEDPNNMNTFSFAKPGETDNPAGGAGMLVAGELWESFLPQSVQPYYSEAAQPLTGEFIRIGNFDRAWSSPTDMWPGGWDHGNYWGQGMLVCEYSPDSTFNPPTIGGVANPAYRSSSGTHYAFASVKNVTTAGSNVPGFTDPARKYQTETAWVDPITRHHAVYKAGWPTNIGVDVKMEIHQYTLNWNNFNDFVIVKLNLRNTGVKDINCDGTAETTNNVIHALTLGVHGEFMCSYFLSRSVGRGNAFGATRAMGYLGDADPSGAPWNIAIGYPGESAAGVKDMGLNDWPKKYYTDVWSGQAFAAVTDSAGAPKQTIYGTDAIGVGAERGWYTSAGQARGYSAFYGYANANPMQTHTLCMGTWYADGGKARNAAQLNLAPNPNFFSSGTPGDPTTFVPNGNPGARPNGDRKLLSEESASSAFEVNRYEAGWTKGFSAPDNFDGDLYDGIGPFHLDVGESMTVYWVEVGGFRLQGICNAMAAARWTIAHNMTPPDAYPAVPVVRVDNTTRSSVKVRWDSTAETAGANFAGYKIYRAVLSHPVDWLQGGMRVLDKYMENTTPGPTPDNLKRAINPSFDPVAAGVAGRTGAADTWGPYELVAVIPQSQLSQYADASFPGFKYSYEDLKVGVQFRYWYYVSAYTNTPVDLGPDYVSYGGTNSATTNSIETSNVNRNGATGLWQNTYPFADLSPFFPKTADGQRAIGYAFFVKSALVPASQLASGQVKITVKPNPYKRLAFFDNATDPFDHHVAFLNLPPQAKITILDVSGQVIKVINFTSSDPNNGLYAWDLFSKDGIEVASGLYIYVVEYQGGQQVGYFSILR